MKFVTVALLSISIVFGSSHQAVRAAVASSPNPSLLLGTSNIEGRREVSLRGQTESVGHGSEFTTHNFGESSNRVYRFKRKGFALWVDPSKWTAPVETEVHRVIPRDLDRLGSGRAGQPDDIKWTDELRLRWVTDDHVNAEASSSGTVVPATSLKDVALERIKAEGFDVSFVSEEPKIINGRAVSAIKIQGSLGGTIYTFYGYYYSGHHGTIRVVTWVPQNQFLQDQKDLTELLNGLIVPEKRSAFFAEKRAEADGRSESGKGATAGARQPGASAPDSPSAPLAGETSSTVTRPVPLNSPRPNYTSAARSNRVEGMVYARALIGADGTVKQVRIVHGLPDGLNLEAARALYQLRFKPGTQDKKPTAFWLPVEVEFALCGDCGLPR